MNIEIEGKIRPLQFQLRQYAEKIHDISSFTESRFQKLRDMIKALAEKVDGSAGAAQNHDNLVATRSTKIDPAVERIEAQLQNMVSALDTGSSAGPSVADENLTSKFRASQQRYEQLKDNQVPSAIETSANGVIGRLTDICHFCDEKCQDLNQQLDEISCTNSVIERSCKIHAESVAQSLAEVSQLKENAVGLKGDSTTEIETLHARIGSELESLKKEADEVNQRFVPPEPKSIDASIAELNQKVTEDCRALKTDITESTSKNEVEQKALLPQLAACHTLLHGKGNILPRLEAIEKRIDWCIEQIKVYDRERIPAQGKGGSPKAISDRLASIRERLASIQNRVSEKDRKK
jgi:hypothetical protein